MYKNKINKTESSVSAGELDEAEKRLGIKIPKELRAHYLHANGGKPERDSFLGAEGLEVRVHTFLPLEAPNKASLVGYYERLVGETKQLPGHLVPFGIDEGGNPLCVDGKTGSIDLCFCDVGDKADIRLVTGSLPEFVDGMVTYDEMILRADEGL